MSQPARVRRVELVRVDHPAYIEEMSLQAAAHRRLGPRQDPGDLYRASVLVESAVRAWLATRVPLLDERVIDADLLPAGERAYVRRFQELDAVVGRDGLPERVVEMKFSASGSSVRRGLSQLARARGLLGHRWPAIAGLLILVEANRTGVELDVERLREVDIINPTAFDRPGQLAPLALLVLAVRDLADHLDADARAIVERGHDEGDSLTAARQIRAAQAAGGGDTADPGQDAPRPRIVTQPSVTFDGGDEAEPESPFAALARLRLEAPEKADAPDGDR